MTTSSDVDLSKLAILAQQHPPRSLERYLALSKLCNYMMRSGKLYYPILAQPSPLDQDIYEEVKQNLFLYICQNIEKYDPNRASLITWANFLLYHRFFPEAQIKINDKYIVQNLHKFDQEQIPSPNPEPTRSELVREYLESDPDNILKNTYIRNHPEANYQSLALRYCNGETWKEIATDLNLSISAITSFYYRNSVKFAPKIKAYCGN